MSEQIHLFVIAMYIHIMHDDITLLIKVLSSLQDCTIYTHQTSIIIMSTNKLYIIEII